MMDASQNLSNDKGYRINGKPIIFEWPYYVPPFNFPGLAKHTKQVLNECMQELSEVIKDSELSVLPNGFLNMTPLFVHSGTQDIERAKNLTKIFTILFYNHDCYDTDEPKTSIGIMQKKYDDIINKIIEGRNMNLSEEMDIFDKTLFYVMSEIMLKYSVPQKKRFKRLYDQLLIEIEAENNLKSGNATADDLDFLFKTGAKNHGMSVTFQMLEYGLDIELSDEEWEDSEIQSLMDNVSRSMLYWHDLCSFRKVVVESKGNLSQANNIIAHLITRKNYSLQRAVDRMIELIREADIQVIDTMNNLECRYANEMHMLNFVRGVRDMLPNGWLFQYGNKRYHGNIEELPPLHGLFVFDVDKTVILIEDKPKSTPYDHFVHEIYNFNKNY